MGRSGSADLPLHSGRVPHWLAGRMAELGGAIVEAMVAHYGQEEFLRRLSDPHWFQAFGAVLGMDWHSSGITTSVMGALKRSLNPRSSELGLYICGGRGRHSRRTPQELLQIAEKTGLDGTELVRTSKLVAKVDNTAVQDGFQLYLHSFVLTAGGAWAVIQQGMDSASRMARRYHWLSHSVRSFVEAPHQAVVGENQGLILNLTHPDAEATRTSLAGIPRESPVRTLEEIRKITFPRHHEVTLNDIQIKRLGGVLAVAHDRGVQDFVSLLLCPGLGPRTLQSLTLVSEVIHGTPSRFEDPARFSFAHGGKDGHPFPVPLKTYDESISVLKDAVGKAKMGRTDKIRAIRSLDTLLRRAEAQAEPEVDFEAYLRREHEVSPQLEGRTVFKQKTDRTPKQKSFNFSDS